MINIWGICEFGEISHDPLRRLDYCCRDFSPMEVGRVKTSEKCCANCIYWLIYDEHLEITKD